MKKSNYAENWADEIRPSILKRDAFKCKSCKVPHRSIGYYDMKGEFIICDEFMINYAIKLKYTLIKVILQVHHKNCNKLDNTDTNLVSLCPKCHFKADKEYNRLKKLCTPAIFPLKKHK